MMPTRLRKLICSGVATTQAIASLREVLIPRCGVGLEQGRRGKSDMIGSLEIAVEYDKSAQPCGSLTS